MTRPAPSCAAPSQPAAGDAITPAAQRIVRGRDAVQCRQSRPRGAFGDRGAGAHLDAQRGRANARAVSRQGGWKGRQDAIGCLDQYDACIARIDGAEVSGQRDLGQLGNGTRHLNAGGAGADHREGQQPSPFVRVLLRLGVLECDQDAAADEVASSICFRPGANFSQSSWPK